MINISKLSLLLFFVIFFSTNISAEILSKNHKKAIAYDCKYNLNDDFDSVNDCKNILVVSLKRDGVLFNLRDFKSKKIKKAERACSKRIEQGVYKYNACLAERLGVNVEIEEPPIVVVNIEEEEEKKIEINENTEEENNTENVKIENENDNELVKETDEDTILTANDLYKKVVKSSFQVAAGTGTSNWSCGSAVVIAKNKLATNCHVILKKGTKDRILKTAHDRIIVINHKSDAKIDSNWYDAKLFASDPNNDVCIIESSQVTADAIEIKPYNEIEYLETVYAIGGPECQRGVITKGQIQNKFDHGYETQNPEGTCKEPNCWNNFDIKMLQTNAHIKGGSSGGGLFDDSGKLVGITTLGDPVTIANPSNIAISADNYLKLLK